MARQMEFVDVPGIPTSIAAKIGGCLAGEECKLALDDLAKNPFLIVQHVCELLGLSLTEDILQPAAAYFLESVKAPAGIQIQCMGSLQDDTVDERLLDITGAIMQIAGGDVSAASVSRLSTGVCGFDDPAQALIAPMLSDTLLEWGLASRNARLAAKSLTLSSLDKLGSEFTVLIKAIAGLDAANILDALERLGQSRFVLGIVT